MSVCKTTFRLLAVMLTGVGSFALSGFMMLGAIAVGPAGPYSSEEGRALAVFSMTVGLVAWLLFAIMGIEWSCNRRVQKFIPIIGTLIAVICLLAWIKSVAVVVVLGPAILLALRLVSFHLRGKEPPRHRWLAK